MVRTQQPRGGMKRKPQIAERRGIDGGERRHGQWLGLGGMIGLDPGVLQARDIGEIGKIARRFERPR